MVDVQFLGLLNATLQAATLLFIASLGELITEKSGILNLGVEGMISIGAVTGFMTAVNTNNIFLAIVVGILSSSILFKAILVDLRIDLPINEYSPDKGTIKPILIFSSDIDLRLLKTIIRKTFKNMV